MVHSESAPHAHAAPAKCDPHNSAQDKAKADILAHAHVSITRDGDFRYSVETQKTSLIPLITASYIMLGELLEQLSNIT